MIYIIHQETLEMRQFALLKPHFSQLKAQGKHWRGYTQTPISSADLELLRSQLQMDINLLPEDFEPQSLRL
ncbi:MAG: hypothetical protein IE936_11385, partial [Moraxella osloensis]|nr:hypothetical protein [Moraxella osloensis]